MRLGKLHAIGRVILFSNTRAADDRRHWEVMDVSNLTRLPSYCTKYCRMTKDEWVARSKLLYTSGAEHTSRIFARVGAGESLFSVKCAHDEGKLKYILNILFLKCAHNFPVSNVPRNLSPTSNAGVPDTFRKHIVSLPFVFKSLQPFKWVGSHLSNKFLKISKMAAAHFTENVLTFQMCQRSMPYG